MGLVICVVLSFHTSCSLEPSRPTTSASTSVTGKVVTESRDLNPYKVTLAIGPAQAMYTGAEAAVRKPKHGHVTVFGGQGSIPPGPSAQGDRHVRVHVHDAVTTDVVDNAQVAISIKAPSGSVTAVPVTTMQDILVGPARFPLREQHGSGDWDLHGGGHGERAAGHVQGGCGITTATSRMTVELVPTP